MLKIAPCLANVTLFLHFDSYTYPDPCLLLASFAACKGLTSLSFDIEPSLPDAQLLPFLPVPPGSWPNLKTLRMDAYENMGTERRDAGLFLACPNLENLKYKGESAELIHFCCPQLRTAELQGTQTGNDFGMVAFNRCKNLTYLDASSSSLEFYPGSLPSSLRYLGLVQSQGLPAVLENLTVRGCLVRS